MQRVLAAAIVAAGLAWPLSGQAAADLYLSIGQGAMVSEGAHALEGPASAELVTSFGTEWLKVDLGFYSTFAGERIGENGFTFRPGLRFTPPVVPVYLRAGVPLHIDGGVEQSFLLGAGLKWMFGEGLGVAAEVNALPGRAVGSSYPFGAQPLPLEGRAGVVFSF